MLRVKKAWDTILGTQIICKDCLSPCQRTGTNQRYCAACSEKRAVARKAKWAKANPGDPETIRERWTDGNKKRRSRILQAGSDFSEANRATIDEVFPDETGMAWVRKLAFPFSYSMSKNHMSAFAAKGHVYLRAESRTARSRLSEAVRKALGDVSVVTAKVWIDIIVHKPNHRGDAINVVDLVCDAIKDAIPVDDRWYSIRRLDWRIVKTDPTILIGIGQESTEDHRICSYCGRSLPFGSFGVNRTKPNGIGRRCLGCTTVSRVPRRGDRVNGSKLNDEMVVEIRRLASEGIDQDAIAEQFGISRTNVSSIVRRKTWKHV